MDRATVGGLIVAFAMISLGAYFEHVTLESIMGLSAFLIVFGGTVGVTAISHTTAELRGVPKSLKLIFFPPRMDYAGMIDYFVSLTDQTRRRGLLSLQDEGQSPNPIVRQGLIMVADGIEPEKVREVLENMLDIEEAHGMRAAAIFTTAGGYCPTIGIMGTVMGLIMVMGNLQEPASLGAAIAVAFLATLYGVGFANILFLPFGTKVKSLIKEQSQFNEMVVAGILSLQSGENPRSLRERLSVYAGSHLPTEIPQTAVINEGRTAEEGA